MGCSQSAPSDTAPQPFVAAPPPPPAAPKAPASQPPPPPPPSSAPQPSSSSASKTSSDARPPPPPPPSQAASISADKSVSTFKGKDQVTNYVNTGNPAVKSSSSERIEPKVGYVVKTMNILDNEELGKLFLNVMHHEAVTTFVSFKNNEATKRTIYNIVIPTKLYLECEKDDALKLNISCQAIDHINDHYQMKADSSQCVFVRSKLGYFNQ